MTSVDPLGLSAALAGVRVLDFSHVIAGPFATFHLARLGAQVTKVERPGGGDVMRRTVAGARAFTVLNDGKDVLSCDFDHPDGQAEVLALAARADVLVDNYRPGVLERRGLGYEAVRARNPRIVYCAISGYGHGDAQWRSRGAYDHVMQALTGMTMMGGEPGDPPRKVGFPVIDAATGILGALAVVAALRERDRNGRGCFLDVSMWAASLQLMYTFASDALATGEDPPRVGNRGFSGSPAADTFECREGWLAIGANTPAQVGRLLDVLGVPGGAAAHLVAPAVDGAGDDGPRFAVAREPAAFRAAVAAALRADDAAHWEVRLNEAGVPAARVRRLGEFTREAVARGLLAPLVLGEGESQAPSPGLGWQVRR